VCVPETKEFSAAAAQNPKRWQMLKMVFQLITESQRRRAGPAAVKQDPRNPNQGFGIQFLGAVHKTTASSGAHSRNHKSNKRNWGERNCCLVTSASGGMENSRNEASNRERRKKARPREIN
jgi:hypothetical protein